MPPHRPEKISLADPELATALQPLMQRLGIQVLNQPDPSWLTDNFQKLVDQKTEKLNEFRPQIASLLSIPGITVELVEKLFTAAEEFYLQHPWEFLADDQPLKLTLKPPGQDYYVMVLGNAGLEFGLLFYTRWEDLEQTYRFASDPLQHLPPAGWLSLSFESPEMLPFEDLDAIEAHGWEVANEHAYPFPAIYRRETIERPGLEELSVFEIALRLIPQFIENNLDILESDPQAALEADFLVNPGEAAVQVHIEYPAGELSHDLMAADYDWSGSKDDESEENEWDTYPPGLGGKDEAGLEQLRQAERLVLQGWQQPTPERRAALARQALELSADCADAYILLAQEESETAEQAIEFFRQGMQAAERVLGERFFRQNAGDFWQIHSARPYMRARQGLADRLAEVGRFSEAIEHYQELLRLNPDDHQGVRYDLLALLLRLKLDDQAWQLLETYDGDEFAGWDFSRALLLFRRQGASQEANRALELAIMANHHIPDFLTGKRPLPENLPEIVGFGDPNEAIIYATLHFNTWWQTPGAVDWLKHRQEHDRAG